MKTILHAGLSSAALVCALILCFNENVAAQTWVQKGTDIGGAGTYDHSGRSLSLSAKGHVLAIGAPGSIDPSYAGSVRMYQWNGSEWLQKGEVINGEAASDQFGHSLSLSDDGNTIAIGAWANDDLADRAGAVYVFGWDGNTWVQKGTDLDGAIEDDEFGATLSLSNDGNTIAVSAKGNAGTGEVTGTVRIYHWENGTWIQKGFSIDGLLYEGFGKSISLTHDGNTVAIGAIGNDDAGDFAGAVRIYDWYGEDWVQKGLDINGEKAYDYSGWSVSMSADGNQVAVGARGTTDAGYLSGHVKIYTWDGNAWVQKGDDIKGESPDQLGWSVSLSNDGNTVSIGAYPDDNNDGYIGYVGIYRWHSNEWIQQGTNIEGIGIWDGTGSSLSMSDNGSTIAIGSHLNNDHGLAAGKVRIYEDDSASGLEKTFFQNFSIYPNPTKASITINLNDFYHKRTLTLKNIFGQIISFQQFAELENSSVIDLTALAPGIYFLEISIDEEHTIQKIVKE